MSVLENFKSFNFEAGVPYVSVTSSGVTFNKAVTMKLGYPTNVLLLFDEGTKRMALQSCDADTPNANTFYKNNKNKILSVRWNSRDLLNTIQDITGWDLSKTGYRINGTLIRDENAMLFDLNTAIMLN